MAYPGKLIHARKHVNKRVNKVAELFDSVGMFGGAGICYGSLRREFAKVCYGRIPKWIKTKVVCVHLLQPIRVLLTTLCVISPITS